MIQRTTCVAGLLGVAASLAACALPAEDGQFDVEGPVVRKAVAGVSSAGTISGRLVVRLNDGDDGVRRAFSVVTPAGDRIELRGADPALGPGPVEVTGQMGADGVLAVETVRSLAAPGAAALRAGIRVPTHHRVAILATGDANISEEQAMAFANGATASLAHFYDETSRGIDTFSAEVFRRYAIQYDPASCEWDNTYEVTSAMLAAFEADGFAAADYDHVAIVVPASCGTDWTGAWADVGSIDDAGQASFELLSMYKDDSFDPWYLAHELGHNMGMDHSRGLDCGAALYEEAASNCSVDEYGNYNDVMGWGEGVYFGTPHERFLGWIDPRRVVTAGGSGTFNLQASDGPRCGLQALRVPIPGEPGAYFYIEYRRPNADSDYAGTGILGVGERSAAVLVSVSNDGGSVSSNARIELGTSRYAGAEVGVVYELGAVSLEVLAMDETARVRLATGGDGDHRDDAGNAVVPEADGAIGAGSCVVDEEPTDAPPTDGAGEPVVFVGGAGCRAAADGPESGLAWALLAVAVLRRRRRSRRP